MSNSGGELASPYNPTSLDLQRIKWPHNGIGEFTRRHILGSMIGFGPGDKELIDKIQEYSNTALNNLADPVYKSKPELAVTAALITNIAAKPLRWVAPHRLVDCFNGKRKSTCIDLALMTHLVLEKIGIQGSQIVGFIDNGLPTFAITYKNQIFTYEQLRWFEIEKFEVARRRGGHNDALFRVYP